MRSLFKNLFNSPMRSPTAEEEYAFKIHLTPGAFPYDEVTNVSASCSISGVRYGLVNGVVSSFASNRPPVEDKGLRGCPAFTQFARYTESFNLWSIDGNVSIVNGYVTKTDSLNGWIHFSANIPPQDTAGLVIFASIELIGTGSIGINMVVAGGSTGPLDLMDTFSGLLYPTVTLNPIVPTKLIVRCVIQESDRTELYFRLRSLKAPFSFRILGEGAKLTLSKTEMPYIPNNTSDSVSVVSEAATATTGTSFDLDLPALSRLKAGLRGPNAQGHIELEFESNISSAWWPSGVRTTASIFNIENDDYRGLRFTKNDAGALYWALSDGINVRIITLPSGILPGQTFRISLDYGTYTDGTQKMHLTVNGVKSGVVAFSGSFGTKDLRFFYGNTVHMGWIKNLSYSEKPLW